MIFQPTASKFGSIMDSLGLPEPSRRLPETIHNYVIYPYAAAWFHQEKGANCARGERGLLIR